MPESDCSQRLLEKMWSLGKHLEPVHSLSRVTEFCLEAFPTVAVNNAAAFLQATAAGTNLETVLSMK